MPRQALAFFLIFVVLFISVNAGWRAIMGETPELSWTMLVRALAIGAMATFIQYLILRKKSS